MEDYSIKLLTPDQSSLFFDIIDSNRSRLEDFFAGTVARTKTLEDTRSYCRQIEERIKHRTYYPYVVIHKELTRIIAFIDVKNIDWTVPKAELGALVDTDFEGQGIITSHLNELIEEIVEAHGFKKLLCRIAPSNTRSINVVKRCGFEWEGTIRNDYKTTKGTIVDLNYYGRIF